MAREKWEGLSVQQIIDQIKQKHFTELDADDFAFMKARADMLSEADRRIYVDGEAPREVLAELGIPMTANERIIHENRPLQDEEMRIRAARDEASRLEVAATQPLGSDARIEADEAIEEQRADKMESLEAEVEVAEKEAAKSEKERAAADKASAKEIEKAQPVKIVADVR